MSKINQDLEILDCFNNPKYAQLAYDNAKSYANNNPFPHMVFDDFLPQSVAEAIAAEYPSVKEMNEKWKFHDNQNVSRFLLEDTTQFSWRMKLFASAITSRSFLLFLETLTGIPALLPDPYFMGGGAMVTGIRNYKVGVDAMRCFISLPIGIKSGKGIWNFGLLMASKK